MSTTGKLTLRNYRCFNWDNPVILEFREGFTAFVGVNNSGKSTALRSIYELRNIFNSIYAVTYNFSIQVQPLGTADPAEIANDSNPSLFILEIEISDLLLPSDDAHFIATHMCLEYNVQSQMLSIKNFTVNAANESKIDFDETRVRECRG